jgi:hypothetical protein
MNPYDFRYRKLTISGDVDEIVQVFDENIYAICIERLFNQGWG